MMDGNTEHPQRRAVTLALDEAWEAFKRLRPTDKRRGPLSQRIRNLEAHLDSLDVGEVP